MNAGNSSQPYITSVAQMGVGRRVPGLRFKVGKLPRDTAFWRPVGKTLLLLLPLALAVNLYVVSATNQINESIIGVDNRHHELMDQNIELRAMRAYVRAPEQLQRLAGEKLSLYAHKKGQVGKYNSRKGYFTYL
ncbi:MAG: hypothetical protein JRJ68_01035 [Deltaproteobacteria bacterium]|nr:hypothetical protein [Deltaproteobacteria bacterium]